MPSQRRAKAIDVRPKRFDEARSMRGTSASVAVPFAAPRGELEGLLDLREAKSTLADVILSEHLSDRLERFPAPSG